MPTIRPMSTADLPFVISIQSECYSADAIECEATIRARLVSSPDTAWVAEDEHGVCAYLVGYLSELGKVTPLGSGFVPSDTPNSLYLHDLAVSRRAAGRNVGTRLVQAALTMAQRNGLPYSSLVSIQDSLPFWFRHGYATCDSLEDPQRKHLDTYPGKPAYLVCQLG
ncbi:N-acetyltransferase [Noviherbaspirillum agri]